MKPKILLSLALVLSGLLFGCSMTPNRPGATVPPDQIHEQVEATAWQITLRNAITNAAAPWMVPFGSIGIMQYTVPADAANILESRPASELLPFLAELRTEPPAWKAGVVDEWIVIVRWGLRGTPSVLTNTMTTPEGLVVPMPDIPVYIYTRMIQGTTNTIMRKQTKSQKLDDGSTVWAFWGASGPPGLMQVSIGWANPQPPTMVGDVKVRVFDSKGVEIVSEPADKDHLGEQIGGYGDGTSFTGCIFFKISTDHPESVAKVEVTYKHEVHLLEFHDAPKMDSPDVR